MASKQATSVSSAAPTTTSNSPTPSTTATPPSTTPTSTPQSSPAQTSSAIVQTTSASSSPQTSPSPSSATPTPTTPTSSSTFTSQVATILPSTDPAGSVVYVTTSVPEVISTSVSTSTGSGSSSHTGVIIGAVVGGVAGIALLVLLLFCIRRRARRDEFDGNFDPDRVGGHDGGGGSGGGGGATLPNVDLAEEVTPFPQSYNDQGSSSMRQYGESPYVGVPSSFAASGQTSPGMYASSAGASSYDAQSRPFLHPGTGQPPQGTYIPPLNLYGTGPADWHNPHPETSPPPSTVSYNTSSTRAAKEREAMGRSGQGQRLGLATQPEAAEGSGDVVVHQDAGRAPIEEHAPPKEIPPAYESIQQD